MNLTEILTLNREQIIGEWVRRFHMEVSERYKPASFTGRSLYQTHLMMIMMDTQSSCFVKGWDLALSMASKPCPL